MDATDQIVVSACRMDLAHQAFPESSSAPLMLLAEQSEPDVDLLLLTLSRNAIERKVSVIDASFNDYWQRTFNEALTRRCSLREVRVAILVGPDTSTKAFLDFEKHFDVDLRIVDL